jgi:two-component system sensor histidine kinase GlrK
MGTILPFRAPMFVFHRLSFRHLLLLAFLVVAGLIAAVALRGVVSLEKLLAQSRESADRAVAATRAAQLLAEHSTSMERAARQYVVLEDRTLRERYTAAARDATQELSRIPADQLPAALAAHWHRTVDTIDDLVAGRSGGRPREAALAEAFGDLAAVNNEIASQLRRTMQNQSQRLLGELDAARLNLRQQLIATTVVALLLAVALGLLLARPFKRLEAAIADLGDNRLDRPIEIRGPADVRRLGRRLDGLRLRLAELEADKARFLRHVSHELKTPLAALREGVALLRDEVPGTLNADQREVAGILHQNTDTLQARIEDLLRFNAAAFEASRLMRRNTELGELVQRLVDEQRLQWQARQLWIEIDGAPVYVQADPAKLGVAVGNLLSNAIRFSPPGSTIRIDLSQQGDVARIEVADRGPGVAPSDVERVFEPFYRGERQPDGGVKGTGIGLSIVHEYVAAHGGRVRLLPSGPGARFQIELPHAVRD